MTSQKFEMLTSILKEAKLTGMVFMPLNLDCHWVLVWMDQDWNLWCLDSLDTLRTRNKVAALLAAIFPPSVTSSVTFLFNNPQKNGLDCGYRILVAIALAANGIVMDDMSAYSRRQQFTEALLRYNVAGGEVLRTWAKDVLDGKTPEIPFTGDKHPLRSMDLKPKEVQLHPPPKLQYKPSLSSVASGNPSLQELELATAEHLAAFKTYAVYNAGADAYAESGALKKDVDEEPVDQLVQRLKNMGAGKPIGWSGGALELQMMIDAVRIKWNVHLHIELLEMKAGVKFHATDSKTKQIRVISTLKPNTEINLRNGTVEDFQFIQQDAKAATYELHLLSYCGKIESEENGNPPSHFGLLWPRAAGDDKGITFKHGPKRFKIETVADDNHCWARCVSRWATATNAFLKTN